MGAEIEGIARIVRGSLYKSARTIGRWRALNKAANLDAGLNVPPSVNEAVRDIVSIRRARDIYNAELAIENKIPIKGISPELKNEMNAFFDRTRPGVDNVSQTLSNINYGSDLLHINFKYGSPQRISYTRPATKLTPSTLSSYRRPINNIPQNLLTGTTVTKLNISQPSTALSPTLSPTSTVTRSTNNSVSSNDSISIRHLIAATSIDAYKHSRTYPMTNASRL